MTRRSKEPESEPGLTFEDLMEAESLGFLEFDMDWGGKPLTIRWVPSRYTPALEALANAAQVTDEEVDGDPTGVQTAVNRQDEAIRHVLAQVLESWSLTKDGKPLPTDIRTLETLPRPFVRAVLGELSGEAIPKSSELARQRRNIVSDGELGDVASWFPILMVARWMGVAPWDLARQPTFWLHAGTSTIAALQAAQDRES